MAKRWLEGEYVEGAATVVVVGSEATGLALEREGRVEEREDNIGGKRE